MKNKERGKRTVQASSWLIPVTWAHRGAGDSPGFTRLGVKPRSASPLKHGERGRDLVGSEVSDAVCKKHLARGGGSRNAGGAGAGRHLSAGEAVSVLRIHSDLRRDALQHFRGFVQAPLPPSETLGSASASA